MEPIRVAFDRGLRDPESELSMRGQYPEGWKVCMKCHRAYINGHHRCTLAGYWVCPYMDCDASVLFSALDYTLYRACDPALPLVPGYGVEVRVSTEVLGFSMEAGC